MNQEEQPTEKKMEIMKLMDEANKLITGVTTKMLDNYDKGLDILDGIDEQEASKNLKRSGELIDKVLELQSGVENERKNDSS